MNQTPLVIDLFCGLGGWAEGLLAEGWEVVGFDIERHRYLGRDLSSGGRKVAADGVDFANPREGSSANRSFNYANEVAIREAPLTGRWIKYPAQLVIQDVLTLHGRQFRDADLIVASPPCQAYSWMAMPWRRAKARAAAIRADETGRMLADLNRLFDACFRIQEQASLAAGRRIPMVVENVRGAQPWVGRARCNFGSFYLWGDVPALMPATVSVAKAPGMNWSDPAKRGQDFTRVAGKYAKIPGFRFDGSGRSFQSASVKAQKDGAGGYGGDFGWDDTPLRRGSSPLPARKAASALIARIPLPLARHVAIKFHPMNREKLVLLPLLHPTLF
jgi:hypothetical protein